MSGKSVVLMPHGSSVEIGHTKEGVSIGLRFDEDAGTWLTLSPEKARTVAQLLIQHSGETS